MKMRLLLSAGIAAFGLGAATTSLQAAPTGGLIAAIDRDATSGNPIETVTWGGRHCHWHYGYRHCGYGYRKWHDHGHYGYGRHYRRHYGYYGYRRWSY